MSADMIRGMGIMLMLYGTATFIWAVLRWYFSRPRSR
jgi:hypothetical protein